MFPGATTFPGASTFPGIPPAQDNTVGGVLTASHEPPSGLTATHVSTSGLAAPHG